VIVVAVPAAGASNPLVGSKRAEFDLLGLKECLSTDPLKSNWPLTGRGRHASGFVLLKSMRRGQ
jgi:hypothetical protein